MYLKFLPLVVAACLAPPSSAQAPFSLAPAAPVSVSNRAAEVITLSSALDRALRSNPELAAAGEEATAAAGSLRQARAFPNPQVEALLEDQRRETRTTTIQVNQTIELGGKRPARISVGEHARELADIDLAAKRAELRTKVIGAFFDVLIAQERRRLAVVASDIAQRGTAIAARRVEAGKVSPVEATRARIAESGVKVELVKSNSELAAARTRLAATWGDRRADFGAAQGQYDDVPALPALAELRQRLQQAPESRRAAIEVARRDAMTRLERARRVPDLTFTLGSRRDVQLGRRQAIFGVAVPLPLFDRNRGNLEEALARAAKARLDEAAISTKLHTDLVQLYERLNALRSEIEISKQEVLPGAQSAFDAAAKGFEYGKFSFLDVLDAQRTLLQARSQHLRALSEAHEAVAGIEQILGAPLNATGAQHKE